MPDVSIEPNMPEVSTEQHMSEITMSKFGPDNHNLQPPREVNEQLVLSFHCTWSYRRNNAVNKPSTMPNRVTPNDMDRTICSTFTEGYIPSFHCTFLSPKEVTLTIHALLSPKEIIWKEGYHSMDELNSMPENMAEPLALLTNDI
ncbi:hypothetical protein Tco_0968533 [Tanacetum coccineum]